MKKILILGAGVYHKELVKASNKLGLYTITVDWNLGNPAHSLSYESYEISATNIHHLTNLIRLKKIDYVISSYSDITQIAWAKLSEYLNVEGPSSIDVFLTINKKRMKAFLNSAIFKTPKSINYLNSNFNFNDGFPFIIKPNQSSGSKGVVIVDADNINQLSEFIKDGLELSYDNEILIEEYINGSHHTVEVIFQNREIKFLTITDKILGDFPSFVPLGHVVPSKLSSLVKQRMKSGVEEILYKIDASSGAIDIDLVVNNEEIHILDLSFRLGGNEITPLINEAYDVDLAMMLTKLSIGSFIDNPCISEPTKCFVSYIIFSEKPMIIRDVEIPKLSEFKGFELIQFNKDFINPVYSFGKSSSANRLGSIIFTIEDYSDLLPIIDNLKKIKFIGDVT